ncbi:MAG: formylglycine-generating enzyme family protein [Metallibacterium sp.]
MLRTLTGLLMLLAALLPRPAPANAAAPRFVIVPGGPLVSSLLDGTQAVTVRIAPFAMMDEPVTEAQFAAFVRQHPEWQRGHIAPLFAGPNYLAGWLTPADPGDAQAARHPVTGVSWFAARAYCDSLHAELPSWYQWEYAAAASSSSRDARANMTRRNAILAALMRATGQRPGLIGQRPANVYGLRDLNRLMWEWVSDYGAMFPEVNGDVGSAGSGSVLRLCGGAALAFRDPSDYALAERVAALSMLAPADSSPFVGFRCVRKPGDTP